MAERYKFSPPITDPRQISVGSLTVNTANRGASPYASVTSGNIQNANFPMAFFLELQNRISLRAALGTREQIRINLQEQISLNTVPPVAPQLSVVIIKLQIPQ